MIPTPSRNLAQLASSGENARLVGMGVGPSRPGCGSPGVLSFCLVGGCGLWLPPPGTCHLPCPFVPCPFARENRPSPSVTLTFPLHPHLWLLIWASSLGESFSAVSESTKPHSLGPHFPSAEGCKVHRCALAQPSRSRIGGARAPRGCRGRQAVCFRLHLELQDGRSQSAAPVRGRESGIGKTHSGCPGAGNSPVF